MFVVSSHWVSGWFIIQHHCGRQTLQRLTLTEPKCSVTIVQPWKQNHMYPPWAAVTSQEPVITTTNSYHLLRTYYVLGPTGDVHDTKQRNTWPLGSYTSWVSLQPSFLNKPVLLNLFRCHHSESSCPEIQTVLIPLVYSKPYPIGTLLDQGLAKSWILVITSNLLSYWLSNGWYFVKFLPCSRHWLNLYTHIIPQLPLVITLW